MNTIKKFIHYYGPYKAVFFIDLICAAVISLVDLAYPQILQLLFLLCTLCKVSANIMSPIRDI